MKNIEFSFELITQNENARLGKIFTSKGEIDTPAFMPVGTQGTLKGIFTDDILKTGSNHIRKHLSFVVTTRFGNIEKI